MIGYRHITKRRRSMQRDPGPGHALQCRPDSPYSLSPSEGIAVLIKPSILSKMTKDLFGSVAELASLSIKYIQGCVKGFVLLSAADGYGSRAEICSCQLDWQHYHFHRWAKLVGLFKEPPELNVPNLTLVARTLQSLEQVLNNTDRLRDDYGLKLDVAAEELDEIHASKALFGGLHILPNAATKDFVSNTAETYQRRPCAWKKLRWAAFDQTKFEKLLGDIQFFNEQLRTTLHSWAQEEYDGASAHTLRALITQSTSQPLLEVITKKLEVFDDAISAAARLKQKSLLLEVLDDNLTCMPSRPPAERLTFGSISISGQAHATLGNVYHTHNHFYGPGSSMAGSDTLTAPDATNDSGLQGSMLISPPIPPLVQRKAPLSRDFKLNYKDLCRYQTSHAANHELAMFQDKQVVIEWKEVPQSLERRLKYRVAAVAELLSSIADPAFHSLHCIGYVRQPKSSHFGYIFEVPSRAGCSLFTLHDLLLDGSLKPSLNQRLTLAAALIETILQLHTVGWLHKSIRPDNVFFFRDRAVANWSKGLPQLYLGGYEFARLDRALETTEAPRVEDYVRLYRHPLSLSEDRIPFCKAFDLYSVGCVLLEIGLWQLMPTMLQDWTMATDKSTFWQHGQAKGSMPGNALQWHNVFAEKECFLSDILSTVVGTELRFSMGEKYTEMVEKCLTAAPMSLQVPPEDDESNIDDSEFSLVLQFELLRDLRTMLSGL